MPTDGKSLARRPPWWGWPDVEAEFDRLQREFSRLSGLFGTRAPIEIASEEWSPAVDIHEGDDAITVTATVPGVMKEDVTVEVEDDSLVIKGEKRSERDVKDKGFRLREVSYGSFYRALTLPVSVEAEKAEATLKDGVLTLKLPKRAEARTKTVTVAVGS